MQRPNEALKLKIAKRLFFLEHPRSNWALYPNYAQQQVQTRYLNMAAAIIWACYEEKDNLMAEAVDAS